MSEITANKTALVVSAHSADFVWRAGGAIALHGQQGYQVHIVCLSFGERGESAKLWRKGAMTEQKVKAARQEEACAAAEILGASIEFFDLGDYPLRADKEQLFRLADVFRRVQPHFVLTHSQKDPYNYDHPLACNLTQEARIIAQAEGYRPGEPIVAAPPVYLFEPHQPEQCEWKPDVLLDITSVWDKSIRPFSAWPVRNTCGNTTPASPSSAACRPSATSASPAVKTSCTAKAIRASSRG
ncbi:hypothetical protein GGER_22490 [Serratia rubidaea]